MSPNPAPFASTIEALHGVARETARRLGKDVRLQVSGELPAWSGRNLSRIQEAIVQAIRNAIDHGIESAETREKAGKPRAGRVSVTFAEVGGDLAVRVEDDGAGIDSGAVARRAVQLGLVDRDRNLASDEALALLFEPGFSTRETVTEVSGRGIGLDIVRENAESLGGKVEIDTARGAGTTLTIRVPRNTLAEAA